MLRLLTLEPTELTDLSLLAARDVLTLEPECYRVHDAMCRFGGVSNLHQATTAGPEIFARTLPDRLRALDGLPVAVREHLDKPATDEMGLYGSLTQAGGPGADTGEPSWAVLGQLLRETRFVQVYRRLRFLRRPGGADRSVLGRVGRRGRQPPLPTLPGVPRLAPREGEPALKSLIEHLDVANVQDTSYHLLVTIYQSKHPKSGVAWAFGFEHLDNTANELANLVHWTTGLDQTKSVQSLIEISPHSHYAKAVIIEKDWARARPHFAEWVKDANQSPVLLVALVSGTLRSARSTRPAAPCCVTSHSRPTTGPTSCSPRATRIVARWSGGRRPSTSSSTRRRTTG